MLVFAYPIQLGRTSRTLQMSLKVKYLNTECAVSYFQQIDCYVAFTETYFTYAQCLLTYEFRCHRFGPGFSRLSPPSRLLTEAAV
jgi:hypothetical protein